MKKVWNIISHLGQISVLNKPIVLAKKVIKGEESKIEEDSGFKVEAVLHAKLSPITRNNMKNKINEYISQTSIVNPYAIIEYETDEGKIRFERRTEVMPRPAKEVLPTQQTWIYRRSRRR